MPRLGLKGKVDVSANVRLTKSRGKFKLNILNESLVERFMVSVAKPTYMPLELKTGRASFSSEHTGQLIIYQMMLSEVRPAPVDAGLLLYLREGVMRQVKGSRNEQRDLILLRNEVAYYLSKQQESYAELCEDTDNDFDVRFKRLTDLPILPEPIHHHNACQNCPYQVLCSLYLNKDPEMMTSLSQQHPLREMASLVTCHLTEAHIEYFCRWVGLLALEDLEAKKGEKQLDFPFEKQFISNSFQQLPGNQLKSMWIETPTSRQQRGNAIINLSLDSNVTVESDEEYIHTFRASNDDLTKTSFSPGDYLNVSTSSRLAVAAGRVRAIKESSIQMCLER